MDIAARAAGRRVHVAVRVHPDETERPVCAPRHLGTRGDGPRGEAMVPAEDERQRPGLEACECRLVQRGADAWRCRGRTSSARLRVAASPGSAPRGRLCRQPRSPSSWIRSSSPAMRSADGPMSTPRRPAAEVERHADDVDRYHRCSAPFPGDRHAFAGRGHNRREQVRVVVDRRKEILHLIALVDHVVSQEEAPRAAVGTRGPGTSCNPASMRRGRRSRRPLDLRNLLEGVAADDRDHIVQTGPFDVRLGFSGSLRVVLDGGQPATRFPQSRPIQIALYPLAAPISSARFAPLDATMSRRNRPSSSDTASWPLSARRISSSNPCKAGVRPGGAAGCRAATGTRATREATRIRTT